MCEQNLKLKKTANVLLASIYYMKYNTLRQTSQPIVVQSLHENGRWAL